MMRKKKTLSNALVLAYDDVNGNEVEMKVKVETKEKEFIVKNLNDIFFCKTNQYFTIGKNEARKSLQSSLYQAVTGKKARRVVRKDPFDLRVKTFQV
jgi:hypothetical protein